MSNIDAPEDPRETADDQSFGDLLKDYEKSHSANKKDDGGKQIEGTVVSMTGDAVLVDIGYKTEGTLPPAEAPDAKVGDKVLVTVKGRGPDGYYQLSRHRVAMPTDWSALERAFTNRETIIGTVTAVVKGGLSVDVGVRAFMPSSRSGVRDSAEIEKLVEQEIRCRIIKLDTADEDVVVDRRIVIEEEERAAKGQKYSEIKQGDTVSGTVRSLTDYGAFVDIGGIDGLLHVGEISWSRVNKPEDVLTVGQQIEAKILKVDRDGQKISLSMKQLLAHPWDAIAEKFKQGDRVRGVVSRVADFGAFVELEPGVEGLIHISEMSWAKRVRTAGDVVKQGETVEAVVLGVDVGARRLSLGLKQALGDPWADAERKYASGAIVQGPVTRITTFGAFVQLVEGVEGLVHVSEMSAEKRVGHPREIVKVGETVRVQVLAVDREKRQIKLSMKSLATTSIDEFLAEHKQGDVVTGRVLEVSGSEARVELGEGIEAPCAVSPVGEAEKISAEQADLSSLTSMLNAKWKGGGAKVDKRPEALASGQIRSFKIVKMDSEAKRIEVEVA